MYGYIYKTTNLINGKIYIGQHKSESFTDYKGSGKILWNAINKYGWDNFKVELICECESYEELNEKEIYYINEYNSTNRSIGYNISRGGNAPNLTGESHGCYGKIRINNEISTKMIKEQQLEYYLNNGWKIGGLPWSEENRKKLSESHKGRKQSEEEILHRVESLRGKKRSEEQRRRMSEAQRNRPSISDETRRKMSESSKKENLSDETRRRLSEARKGKSHSEETIRKMSEKRSKSNHNRKWINNGIENKFIKEENLQQYLDNGWILGMMYKLRK